MSASGGIASVTVMLPQPVAGIRRQYLLLSVFGGAALNPSLLRPGSSSNQCFYHLPVLFSGRTARMGAITGMALRVVMPHLDRLSLKINN